MTVHVYLSWLVVESQRAGALVAVTDSASVDHITV